MGNACFCEQVVSYKSEQILIKDTDDLSIKEKHKKKNKIKSKNKMDELLNYFNESEKEIINNLKKKGKPKRIPTKKRLEYNFDIKDNNKYELMLKRLLEQQNIKKNGPKRRETIRDDGKKIDEMVKNILIENKNDILNSHNHENNILIARQHFNKKGRFSVTLDRNPLLMNKLNSNKKRIQEQYLNNRKTICEVIGETKEYYKDNK